MRFLALSLLAATAAFGQTATQVRPTPEQGPPPRNLTERPDGHFSANLEPDSAENFEIYIVQPGETLSQIATQALKDARLWPQLWELNEHIVNPHWIYPNDKIRIRAVTLVSEVTPPPPPPVVPAEPPPPVPQQKAPSPSPPEPVVPSPAPQEPVARPAQEPVTPPAVPVEPQEAPPPVTFESTGRVPVLEVKDSDLYCSGFIRMAEVPRDLKIIGVFGTDGGALASEGDYIYLSQGSEDGVANGSMYRVVRPTRQIEKQEGRTRRQRELGMHYLDVAQVVVVVAQPDFSLARVYRSCDVVELGDWVMPFEVLEAPVVPTPRTFGPFMTVTGDIKGSIVTTLGTLLNFGTVFKGTSIVPGVQSGDLAALEKGIAFEGTVVYIDVGEQDGVRVGDQFIVFQRTNLDNRLYTLPEETRLLRQERRAVGELIVLKTGERASTALVTYAADALSAGDPVERR